MIVRGLIIDKNKILLFHRFKNGREYFSLPGGHVEEDESPKEALIREVEEETTLKVEVGREFFRFLNSYDNLQHYFFLITKFKGIPELSGEEKERNSENNRYILEWRDIKEVKNINLVPEIIKDEIIKII